MLHNVRLKRDGLEAVRGKIVSTEPKRRTDQGLSFLCVNQFLQPPGISSVLLQEKKWPRQLVEHLVELKCNIASQEFQRDKTLSTYYILTFTYLSVKDSEIQKPSIDT